MITSPTDLNVSLEGSFETSPRLQRKGAASTTSSAAAVEREANFWEIGKYKRVVKRIDDAAFLCDSLVTLAKERAAIEKKYATMLRSFSKRWNQRIERGPEDPYGTLREAWKALLLESDAQADVHADLDAKLTAKVQADVAGYKKDNYSKGLLSYKVTVQATDGFEAAQKPWAKAKDKAARSKKAYHAACRTFFTLEEKIRDGESSGSLNHEELVKLKEKLSQAKDTMDAAREKYQTRVRALNDDVSRYRSMMSEQFQSCQDLEQRRMDFFKRTMGSYQEIVAIDSNPCHKRVASIIDAVSSDADLLRYAQVSGVGMPLLVPQFTEYNEEEEPEVISQEYLGLPEQHHQQQDMGARRNSHDSLNDVSDDDWEEVAERLPPPPDNPNQGLPVRALYDYTAEEPEEISFAAGELLIQLEDEDEQGWCQGQNAKGEIGLYPANYVEPLA